MERKREPVNAQPDTGRKGYRLPEEPLDERPVIAFDSCRCKACRQRVGMWANDLERATYETAVAMNPKREDEGPMAYARRISQIVTEEYAPKVPVRVMPKAGRVRL